MLFTTPTQFAVLLLLLIVGWLFGLASHPGGKKWKQAYRDEQAARARDLAERDARISELEAANARLGKDRARTPVAASAARPARSSVSDKRGWFEWDRRSAATRPR